MTDWTGSGSTISVTPPGGGSCLDYLTVAAVRAEFGADVAEETDASIQRRIDQMSALMEDQLGHTFGRALIVRSTASLSLQVTATALVIGTDTFLFADYPTLYHLVSAINLTGSNYSAELLSKMRGETPSTLLKTVAATPCGPDYEDRVVLCTSALYVRLSGERKSHLFVPLPIAAVTSVVETGVTLAATDYWALSGENWLIRKACSCTCSCTHARGRWLADYPGNILVTYVPVWWNSVPGALTGVLLDAYSARGGIAPFEAETFGDYSYRRPAASVSSWTDILGSGLLRPYVVRFQP